MLRLLLVLLLAANAFWWAATHGVLPASWLPFPDPEAEREPERLKQQVRPEAIKILPPGAPAPPVATACLQTAEMPEDAVAAAEELLRAAGIEPARWRRTGGSGLGVGLRVDAVTGEEQDALRAAAALAASAPSFSPCS